MRMAVLGIEKVVKTWERMDIGVVGLLWVGVVLMTYLNGKKHGGRRVTGQDTRN